MRILWIEDLPTESLAIALFKKLLNSEDFESYDKDTEISEELPKFFKDNSIHDISICKGYSEFIKNEELLRYDIFIIDLDLSSEDQKNSEVPREFENREEFHKKAGFYIWSLLIRKGIPEDHIAFMTGNGDSVGTFKNHCINSIIPPLKDENVFEKAEEESVKNKKGYTSFRQWLQLKADNKFIQLRRGILDACEFFQKKDHEILLNRALKTDSTTGERIDTLPPEYGKEYVIHIQNLIQKDFFLNEKEKHQKLYTLLMVISAEWEKTYFQKGKPISFYDSLKNDKFIKIFHQTNLWIMKNLRNNLSHFSFGRNVSEEDVAFFFIIAMRNFFEINGSGDLCPFEKVLLEKGSLKKELEKENLSSHLKGEKKRLLEFCINRKIQKELKKDNYEPFTEKNSYLEMAYECMELPKNKNPKKITKKDITEHSKKYLYNAFLFQLSDHLQDPQNKNKIFYRLGCYAMSIMQK